MKSPNFLVINVSIIVGIMVIIFQIKYREDSRQKDLN